MGLFSRKKTLEDFDKKIALYQDRLNEPEQQDDTRYRDLQSAFNSMQANYHKLVHSNLYPEVRKLEFAEDMERYADALARIKFARFMSDNDTGDDKQRNFERRTQEAFGRLHQIGEKFRGLLGVDFQEVNAIQTGIV